jgi:thiamine monophosphate synthase
VATLCRQAGAALIVNDRADIAKLLGAGLHVGQDDLPPPTPARCWAMKR